MRLCLHRLIQCAMQEKDLKEILNAAYELEGLLQLSLTGKQDLSRLHDLIVDKGHLISSLCDRLPAAATESGEGAAAGYYVVDEAADDSTAAEPVENGPAVKEQPGEPLPAEPEAVPDFSHIEGVSFADTPDEPEEQAPAQDAAPAHQPLRLRNNPGGRPKLRRLFPINEVFLFRRELFGGSDVDFNASLSIVEDLDTYDAAEDYFVSDLQWDMNDPTVGQFLAIIKKYFKQQ